jgi:hypothetical protein
MDVEMFTFRLLGYGLSNDKQQFGWDAGAPVGLGFSLFGAGGFSPLWVSLPD